MRLDDEVASAKATVRTTPMIPMNKFKRLIVSPGEWLRGLMGAMVISGLRGSVGFYRIISLGVEVVDL